MNFLKTCGIAISVASLMVTISPVVNANDQVTTLRDAVALGIETNPQAGQTPEPRTEWGSR